MDSCVDGHVVLKNGLEVDSNTIVWTAGVKPNPALARYGLPLGPRGHVDTAADPPGHRAPTTSGPRATTPRSRTSPPARPASRTPGARRTPSTRCGRRKVLGDNVISGMRGFPQKDYSHANKGAVAGLGLHKGVAMIVMGKMKIKLKGRLAWYMHRGYHGMAMPTWNRKIRVFADWTLAMFLKREVVSLGAMETPREEFYEAAKPAPAPPTAAEAEDRPKAKAS